MHPGITVRFDWNTQTDHVAQNKAVKIVNAAASGVKDGVVATGTFIGEEAARVKLRQSTVTEQAFKTTGTFIGEEAARFHLGQKTTTENFVRFLGEEAARSRLGEQTYMGTVAKEKIKTFLDTPAEQTVHNVFAGATQLMLFWELGVGARTVINATPTAAKFAANAAKNAAKATGEFVAAHDFQSPITFQFNSSTLYSGIPVDSVKFRNPVKGAKAEPRFRRIEYNNCLIYEDAGYHGKVDTAKKSRAPTNPKTTMDISVEANAASKVRISYDPETKEIVIFRFTGGNTFHGHIAYWDSLEGYQKSILIKEFNFTPKGKPPKR